MTIEIKVPTLGESISEAIVGTWFKNPGDAVAQDEPLVELETDKVTVEVPAPVAGVMGDQVAKQGEQVNIGGLLGYLTKGDAHAKASGHGADAEPKKSAQEKASSSAQQSSIAANSPAVSRIARETGINPENVSGTGKDGRVTKGDMLQAKDQNSPTLNVVKSENEPSASGQEIPSSGGVREERVRMSKLRQTIARRLKEAQSNAAMLTTFNEVDMTAVIENRKKYKDLFEKKHGVKLGFMSFFVKACIAGLKDLPAVNAEIRGDEIVYKNYYHIGVAVGTEKGLVVPVLRDADQISLADIEKKITDFGKRAREGKIGLEEMQGGTFTISNGGIYGSLMSTPILNAPQSAILGMHKIQERPVVVDGTIQIRPMMYLAVSYDHRIIDGREAVTFLVRIKEGLEDPTRLVLDL